MYPGLKSRPPVPDPSSFSSSLFIYLFILFYLNQYLNRSIQFSIASLRPVHPNTKAFSKVSVFISAKTKQNIFIHTSVFVSFAPIHTKTLENDENDWDCSCANFTRPSAILDRCPDLDWNQWHVTFFFFLSHRFQKCPFSPVHARNEAFSKVFTLNRF